MSHATFHAAHTQSVRYLELLSRAVAHIHSHLAEPLDGEVLADAAAMSRYHFQRIFRAYVGTTVAGYVTWCRLQRACELLAQDMTVRDVAFAVGYESPQALAKAMRRELSTTPLAVRTGGTPRWQHLFDRRPAAPCPARPDSLPLRPRMVDLPALPLLAATACGMRQGDMTPAAEKAFGELVPAVRQAGLMPRATGWLALFPDAPQGLDDQQARMVCGALFDQPPGAAMHGSAATRPDVALQGSLRWWQIDAGRYAVFTHAGPHALLRDAWDAIYGDWLPATGYALRDTPCFEHYASGLRPQDPDLLRTDLYLPLK